MLSWSRDTVLSSRSLVKHLPDWFPGTGFKRRARHGMKLSHEMVNAPFDTVKEDLVCSPLRRLRLNDNLIGCDRVAQGNIEAFACP